MSGKYGKNQWKINFLFIICAVAAVAVIVGLAGGAYVFIRPKYAAYQEAKALKAEEEKKEAAKAEVQKAEAGKAQSEKKTKQETEPTATPIPEPTATPTIAPAGDLSGDYVIADSNARYLTESDIQNFTLQQINYAKNEIYARRGRKFQSRELQDYFNSKSWYNGTIEPNAFSDSMFNDYERVNAAFLSKIEFSRDPKGYVLDQ